MIALQAAAAFIVDNGELTGVKRINEFVKDTAEPGSGKRKRIPSQRKVNDQKPTESPDTIPGSIAK